MVKECVCLSVCLGLSVSVAVCASDGLCMPGSVTVKNYRGR